MLVSTCENFKGAVTSGGRFCNYQTFCIKITRAFCLPVGESPKRQSVFSRMFCICKLASGDIKRPQKLIFRWAVMCLYYRIVVSAESTPVSRGIITVNRLRISQVGVFYTSWLRDTTQHKIWCTYIYGCYGFKSGNLEGRLLSSWCQYFERSEKQFEAERK